jgi:hypothetical protein
MADIKLGKRLLGLTLSCLVLIFSCTNYDPWIKAGFTPQNADSWIELKFTAQEATQWEGYGFSPAESLKWKAKKFNAREAGEFKQNGYELKEANLWNSENFNAQETKGFQQAGFTLEEAIAWKTNEFSHHEAQQWRDNNFTLNEATSWRYNNFTVSEAQKWGKQGISLTEAEKYRTWEKEGYSADDADLWSPLEPNPKNVRKWQKLGLGTSKVKKAKNHNLTIGEFTQWQELELGLDEAIEVKNKGVSVNDAKRWIQAGLSIQQAVLAKQSGFQLEEASAWNQEGYIINQAIEAKSQGLSLAKVQQGHKLTKIVIAEGVGTTEKEAIVDASRSAVKQTVGTYLVSETLMQNDELVKDEVLSYSRGYVEGFEIIKKEKNEGLIEVTASVRVAYKRLETKLGNLNLTLKDIGTTAFKAVEYDKFSAAKEFKNIFSKLVIEPLYSPKTYQANIINFRPASSSDLLLLDWEPNSKGSINNLIRLPTYWVGNDKEKANFGGLFPYILVYNVSLSSGYLSSLEDFFGAIAEEELGYEPFTPFEPRNPFYGLQEICSKVKNTCKYAQLKKNEKGEDYYNYNYNCSTSNQPDFSDRNSTCNLFDDILNTPICKDGGREFSGNWIMLGESKFLGDARIWKDQNLKLKSSRSYKDNFIYNISSRLVEDDLLGSSTYASSRVLSWRKYLYFNPFKSYRLTDNQGYIINAFGKRFDRIKELMFKISLLDKHNNTFKQKHYATSDFRWDGHQRSPVPKATLSASISMPSIKFDDSRIMGRFDSNSKGGFNFMKGYHFSNCRGNDGLQMVFSENKWENSLVIWLDQDSVESLSGIEITTLIRKP